MKKKAIVPLVGFKNIMIELDCGKTVLDLGEFIPGCIGFALLFEDLENVRDFLGDTCPFPGVDYTVEDFTIKAGLPPWADAKGEG